MGVSHHHDALQKNNSSATNRKETQPLDHAVMLDLFDHFSPLSPGSQMYKEKNPVFLKSCAWITVPDTLNDCRGTGQSHAVPLRIPELPSPNPQPLTSHSDATEREARRSDRAGRWSMPGQRGCEKTEYPEYPE